LLNPDHTIVKVGDVYSSTFITPRLDRNKWANPHIFDRRMWYILYDVATRTCNNFAGSRDAHNVLIFFFARRRRRSRRYITDWFCIQIASRPGIRNMRCLFRVAFVPRDACDLAQQDLTAFEYLYMQVIRVNYSYTIRTPEFFAFFLIYTRAVIRLGKFRIVPRKKYRDLTTIAKISPAFYYRYRCTA
jgi:hypothetical protein